MGQLIKGTRGPGGFPAAQLYLGRGRALYSWRQVSTWFAERLGEIHDVMEETSLIPAINAVLQLRRYAPSLPDPAGACVAGWVHELMPEHGPPEAVTPTELAAMADYELTVERVRYGHGGSLIAARMGTRGQGGVTGVSSHAAGRRP